jgi:DsbC/DsbD-like thiol-disulfide interchange protein
MAMVRAARPVLLVAALALLAAPSGAADGSAWSRGHHSRARLFSADAGASGTFLAGIEIKLDPGFKTYWRNPGESGLPPAFDWSGSENVGETELLWPAPTRFEDAGGVSYGYADGVVFPVRIRPRDVGKPLRLALKLDYGVCKDICIPAHADLALSPSGEYDAIDRTLVERATARVPARKNLGAEGDLSILALAPEPGANDALVVTARTPKSMAPRLFVEGPTDWFFTDAAPGKIARQDDHELGSYRVKILERPRQAPATIELRLTLVAGERSIETTVRLDTAALAR